MIDGRTERDPQMLPSLAEIMQPGMPQVPHSGPMQVHNQPLSQIVSPPGMTYVVPELKPLTPPPTNLQMARPSRPWRMYGRVVGLVILLFLFEIFVFDGWLYAIYYGDTLTGSISLLCAIPILLWVVAIRRHAQYCWNAPCLMQEGNRCM